MRKLFLTAVTVPVMTLVGFNTFFVVIFILFFSMFRFRKGVIFVIRFWAKSSFLLMGKKVEVLGKENIDPKKHYILIANHGSLFDILAIMSFSPNVSWLGKEQMMKVPLFGAALKAINYVPMKRADLKNTKDMIDKMITNSGSQTIAIFPEGTRTLDGNISRFKKGFIHVFKATQSDILPVTLNGFYNLRPKNRYHLDFRTKLQIIIHKAFKSEEIIDKTNEEIVDLAYDKISGSYKI